MKKSHLVFLIFSSSATTALGQSSVTIFGTIDLNGRYVKNDGSARRLSLSQDGLNQSQFGFRGIEDLGGGLKASFTLIQTLNADTGSVNNKFWNRRSTVSLYTPAGEIRLGRDYVPTFWNNVLFDAFLANGIGNSFNVWQLQATYAVAPAFGNFARADNSIGYFLPPNLGGIYGQAMVSASEGGGALGRLLGARLGYAVGKLDTAAAVVQQRFDAASNPAVTGITAGSNQKTYNLGASYDFVAFKLLGYIVHDTRPHLHETRGSISTVIPLPVGELHLAYNRSKLSNGLAHNSNTVSLEAATYQYALSKSTSLYGTVASLSNGSHPLLNVTQSIAGWNAAFAGTAQTAQPFVGGRSRGFEVGIRQFF